MSRKIGVLIIHGMGSQRAGFPLIFAMNFVTGWDPLSHDSSGKRLALQQNLWVTSGSGKAPSV